MADTIAAWRDPWVTHGQRILKGSDEETLGEFFDRLVIDRAEEEAKAKEDCDDEKNDEDEEETEVVDLTVPWLSKFFMEMFDMEKVPFHLEGETNETLLTALSEKIAQEIQSVEGYVSTWRGSGVMGAVVRSTL